MASKNKTAAEAIVSVVNRGPKKGLTAIDISDRTDITLNTVRFTLTNLVKDGAVQIIGQTQTGTRGRPASIYGKVA